MRRFLPVLAVAAAVLVLLAGWAVADRIATSVRVTQGLMLPDLPARAEDIRSIELLQGDRTVRLERGADGSWTLASRDHYPCDLEMVRGLVAGLSQLQKDQALTRKPQRHQELNLAWPDPEGRARLIRLFTGAEQPPLEMVLGQERLMPRTTYVRRMGDDQAWRCRGGVNGDVDVQRWMRRDLLSLPSSEFLGAEWMGLQVTPRPARGDQPKTRPADQFDATAQGSPDWTPAQVAASRGVLPEWPSRMEFDDVRAARPDFSPAPDRTLSFRVKGATLTLQGRREGDATWFRVQVQPQPGASEPTRNPVAGDPWIPGWNAFAKKVSGWEFRLPAWREAQLARLRSDEPEPKAPPEPDLRGKDRLPPPSSSMMR